MGALYGIDAPMSINPVQTSGHSFQGYVLIDIFDSYLQQAAPSARSFPSDPSCMPNPDPRWQHHGVGPIASDLQEHRDLSRPDLSFRANNPNGLAMLLKILNALL